MIWGLGLIFVLWLIYRAIMPSHLAQDVLSKMGGAFDGNRSGNGRMHNEQAISVLFLLASDVLAGVGLRSALRSFLRSHAPLIEFSTGVEVNVQQLEQPENPARPILSLPLSDTHRDPKGNAPFVIEVKGLKNRGQTCYANSVMQALASIQPLCVYLDTMQQSCVGKGSAASALFDTLQYINGHQAPSQKKSRASSVLSFGLFSSSSPGDPQRVMNIVAKHHSQFRSRSNVGMAGMQEQQDSHEFFSALMDVLSSEEQVGEESTPNTNATSHDGKGLACCNDIIGSGDRLGSFAAADASRVVMEERQAVPGGNAISDEPEEEEKKHEDHVLDGTTQHQSSPIKHHNQNKGSLHSREEKLATEASVPRGECSSTRNPFDGWSGSTIKCASCRHIRPIRSTPFLGMSLPIASIQSEYLEDFLAAEYGGFASAERVSDVQCFSCAIQQKIQDVEEEDMLLSGAISSIQRRSKGKSSIANGNGCRTAEKPGSDIGGLLQESQQLKRKIAILKALDPDADEDKLDCSDDDAAKEEMELGIKCSLPDIVPLRGDAYKASLVLRPPKVLCIHIQRRHYDMTCHKMVKVTRHVKFEEELNLAPYCEYGGNSFEKQRVASAPGTKARISYRLMSVVEHLGNAFGGHYQTYRRIDTQQSDKWVLVSDESVSSCTWDDVRKCQGYLLFYVAAPAKG